MDADRKKVTWENYYRIIYTKEEWEFFGLLDFDNPNNEGKVKFKDVNYNEIEDEKIRTFYWKYKDLFLISGDADFEYKTNGKKNPEMHKFKNFSLMPVKGGMNNCKGTKSLSSFLRENIMEYYANKESNVGLVCRFRLNEDCSKDFMDLFDGVYDYAKKMYLLDKTQVDYLMDLDRAEDDARMYYWKIKEELYKKKNRKLYNAWHDKDIDKEEYC